jgi:hypothetical protein
MWIAKRKKEAKKEKGSNSNINLKLSTKYRHLQFKWGILKLGCF